MKRAEQLPRTAPLAIYIRVALRRFSPTSNSKKPKQYQAKTPATRVGEQPGGAGSSALPSTTFPSRSSPLELAYACEMASRRPGGAGVAEGDDDPAPPEPQPAAAAVRRGAPLHPPAFQLMLLGAIVIIGAAAAPLPLPRLCWK